MHIAASAGSWRSRCRTCAGARGRPVSRSGASPRDAPADAVIRFDVQPPGKTSLSLVARPSVALSPDGSMMAFVASTQGESRAVPAIARRRHAARSARDRGRVEPGLLARRQGDRVLRRRTAQEDDARRRRLDGERGRQRWRPARNRVAARRHVGVCRRSPPVRSFKCHRRGGTTRAITTLDEKKGERTHRWPAALPGGKASSSRSGRLAARTTTTRRRSRRWTWRPASARWCIEGASSARYATSGHLLFVRESILYAVPFDVDSLTTRGTPVQVLRGVNGDTTTGASHVAVAENGTHRVHARHRARGGQSPRVGRSSGQRRSRSELPQGLYFDPRISPDGTRVAVTWQTLTRWQWRHLGQRSHAQYVHTPVVQRRRAVASLVGRRQDDLLRPPSIRLAARRPSCAGRPTAAATPSPWPSSMHARYLQAVTPDEKTALLDYQSVGTAGGKGELVTLALAANAKPQPLVTSAFDDYAGTWSPDRTLAGLSVRRKRTRGSVRARHVECRRPLASLNQRR